MALAFAVAHPAPRPLAEKCGTPGQHVAAAPFWLTAADGVHLYALEAGTGNVGIVLLHEYPADLCGWLPYMPTLQHAGFRVLAFDFRGYGDSDRPQSDSDFVAYGRDVRAAVAKLHADGAKKVFVVGASFGGVAAVMYAPGLDVAGVVSMSGELALRGNQMNALAAAPRLRVPFLLVGSRHDPNLSVPDALKMLHRIGSHDKRTALYPGSWHGWDIVEAAPYAAKARALVARWLHVHS